MTCDEFNGQVGAWQAGTLSEAEALAVEAHAVECEVCGPILEEMSRLPSLPRELPASDTLRSTALAAVGNSRRRRGFRRGALGLTGIAAAVLALMVGRPHVKSASDFPGAGQRLMAMALAKPEIEQLNSAEMEILSALKDQPQDPALLDGLRRIKQQRDGLHQLVQGTTQ